MSKADIEQISRYMDQLQQMRNQQPRASVQPQSVPSMSTSIPVPDMLRDMEGLSLQEPMRRPSAPIEQPSLGFNPVLVSPPEATAHSSLTRPSPSGTQAIDQLGFQPNPNPPRSDLMAFDASAMAQRAPLPDTRFNPGQPIVQQQQQQQSTQGYQADDSILFAPASISLETSDQDPSTRPVEHKKFSQQGLRMRQRAVLNCKTPCTGTEKGEPWCFLGSKSTLDKVPPHELHGSDLTILETNNGRDRWRHCKVKTNGESYMKLDEATHQLMVQRANAIEAIIDNVNADKELKGSTGLTFIFMVHFALEYDDARDLSMCEFLTENEKMWTAGLWQFATEFVKDRKTTPSAMLQSKISVDDWKQRLQKFMHGAKAGDPLADVMNKVHKSGRASLDIASGRHVDDMLGTFIDESESEDEEDLEEVSMRQAIRGAGAMDPRGMDEYGFDPQSAFMDGGMPVNFAPYPAMMPNEGYGGYGEGEMEYGYGM
jgi:hypothetical protein